MSEVAKPASLPVEAVALLKRDPRVAEALLKEFENADEDEQGRIAVRVCQLLTVHETMEQGILHPAPRQSKDEAGSGFAARDGAIGRGDARFKETVEVLSRYLRHHLEADQKEPFAQLGEPEQDVGVQSGALAWRRLASS